MPIHGNDSTILKSFIKSINKITKNYTEETLTKELPILQAALLDENNKVTFKKFVPNEKYYLYLLAYRIINAIKETNSIYNAFMVQHDLQNKEKNINKRKKTKKLPNDWKIINGGKK